MKKYNYADGPPNWLIGEEWGQGKKWIIDLEGAQLVQVEGLFEGGVLRFLPYLGKDFDRITSYVRRIRTSIIEKEKHNAKNYKSALNWANEEPSYGAPASCPNKGLYSYIAIEDPLYDQLGIDKIDEENYPWWYVEPARNPFLILSMSGNPDEVAPMCEGEWSNGKLKEASDDDMIRAVFSV